MITTFYLFLSLLVLFCLWGRAGVDFPRRFGHIILQPFHQRSELVGVLQHTHKSRKLSDLITLTPNCIQLAFSNQGPIRKRRCFTKTQRRLASVIFVWPGLHLTHNTWMSPCISEVLKAIRKARLRALEECLVSSKRAFKLLGETDSNSIASARDHWLQKAKCTKLSK